LAACLRRNQSRRTPYRWIVAANGSKLQYMVLIDQLPPEVKTRLILGHYEGKLIPGAGEKSAFRVLVVRTSRFTFLCHLLSKDATNVRAAFKRKLDDIPPAPLKSLTFDQGKGMAHDCAVMSS
jgi:IS30 family transposase